MGQTVAEHLRNGRPVVSDQKAIQYAEPGGPSFNKMMSAYTSYQYELGRTKSNDQKKRLEGLIMNAKSALVDFLGSEKAVNDAVSLWQGVQQEE